MSADTAHRVITPTAGRVLKRSLFWVGVAAFIGIVAVIVLGSAGSQADANYLDATNAAPNGTRAVAEVLVMNDALRELIARTAPISEFRAQAQLHGWAPLKDAALELVRRGETTLGEVARVAG